MLRKIVNSPYFLWALLTLPSIPMFYSLATGMPDAEGRPATEFLLHPTGEFAARFMIAALILTPMRMVFPRAGFLRWMMARRRYFGVAAFAYAALHTLLYVIDVGSLQAILGEFLALGIWTGWLAMFVMVPLALTSNDFSIRRLGRSWKMLQRTVYMAAAATLIHWIFVHNNIGPALVHFLPLAGLEAYRIWRNLAPRTARNAQP